MLTRLELKIELHCCKCTAEVLKAVRKFKGVYTVSRNLDGNIVVIGDVDPFDFPRKLGAKIHKTVELLKSGKPPVTVGIFLLKYCCDKRCEEKISKIVSHTWGYIDMSFEKKILKVVGLMDMEALEETLKEKLIKTDCVQRIEMKVANVQGLEGVDSGKIVVGKPLTSLQMMLAF